MPRLIKAQPLTLFGRVAARQRPFVERLSEIFDEILHVLEANRQPEQARGDPERRASVHGSCAVT